MSEWENRFRQHAIFQTVSGLKSSVRSLMKKYRIDGAFYDGLERLMFVVCAVEGKLKSAQPRTVSFAAMDRVNQSLIEVSQRLASFFDLLGDAALEYLSLANQLADVVTDNLPLIEGSAPDVEEMNALFAQLREDYDGAVQGLVAERDGLKAQVIQLWAQIEELMSRLAE